MSRSYVQRFPVPPWRYRLERVAEQCIRDFNTQELGNTKWTFAQMQSMAAAATMNIKHSWNPDKIVTPSELARQRKR